MQREENGSTRRKILAVRLRSTDDHYANLTLNQPDSASYNHDNGKPVKTEQPEFLNRWRQTIGAACHLKDNQGCKGFRRTEDARDSVKLGIKGIQENRGCKRFRSNRLCTGIMENIEYKSFRRTWEGRDSGEQEMQGI